MLNATTTVEICSQEEVFKMVFSKAFLASTDDSGLLRHFTADIGLLIGLLIVKLMHFLRLTVKCLAI